MIDMFDIMFMKLFICQIIQCFDFIVTESTVVNTDFVYKSVHSFSKMRSICISYYERLYRIFWRKAYCLLFYKDSIPILFQKIIFIIKNHSEIYEFIKDSSSSVWKNRISHFVSYPRLKSSECILSKNKSFISSSIPIMFWYQSIIYIVSILITNESP